MVDRIIGGKGFGPIGSVNRNNKPGAEKKSSETGKSDRVDFSQALQQASQAQDTGATQATARTEKVQALKEQIANGSYQPDLEKVASSMLPFILKDI